MSFSPLHCKYSLINNPTPVTRLMMIAFAGFVLKSPANLLFTASSQGYNRRFGTAIKLLMRKRFYIYINSSYVTCISCRTFYFLINPPRHFKTMLRLPSSDCHQLLNLYSMLRQTPNVTIGTCQSSLVKTCP